MTSEEARATALAAQEEAAALSAEEQEIAASAAFAFGVVGDNPAAGFIIEW